MKVGRDVTDEQRSRRPIFNATLRAAASWLTPWGLYLTAPSVLCCLQHLVFAIFLFLFYARLG